MCNAISRLGFDACLLRFTVLLSSVRALLVVNNTCAVLDGQNGCGKTVCYVRANANPDDLCKPVSGIPEPGMPGAVAQRPVNYMVNLFQRPNTSVLFYCNSGSWGIESWAERHPEFLVNVRKDQIWRDLMDRSATYTKDWILTYKEYIPHYMREPLGPDIAQWWPGRMTMALKDDLLDLRGIFEETGLDKVLDPRQYQACQDTDGSVYCASYGGTPWWFIAHVSVFERYGVKNPKTFDDMLDMCRKLRAGGIIPIGMPGKTDFAVSAFFDLMNMRVNGATFHEELCAGQISWTDERIRRTFLKWQELVDARCFNEAPIIHGAWESPFSDLVADMKIASVFLADWYRRSPFNRKDNLTDVDVFIFPEITPGVVRGNMIPADAFVVRRTTEQKVVVGSLLSEELMRPQPRNFDVRTARTNPRLDVEQPPSRFNDKLEELLDATDLQWTAFDLQVRPEFWDEVKYPLQLWMNGSKPLDELLALFEDQRVLVYDKANLAPVADKLSGSYEDEVVISLSKKNFSGAEKVSILFSVNDEDSITQTYNSSLRFGPGEWTIRAQVVGGDRAKSQPVRFVYTVLVKGISEEVSSMLMILTIVLGVILLACLLYAIVAFVRHYKNMRRARKKLFESKRARVRDAIAKTTTLSFPMCVISFGTFRKLKKMTSHEHVLALGDLIFLHTYEQVREFQNVHEIVFVSHQWLAKSHPDPKNIQYRAISSAVVELCAARNLVEDEVYLWLDFSSIPQVNVSTKLLSISSLAVYASTSSYFLVVAPEAIHSGTNVACNYASYMKRGWCRLEQWACFALSGHANMCSYCDSALEFRKEEMNPEFFQVFAGDYSVESDKLEIVDTVIGLWAHSIHHVGALPDGVQSLLQKDNKAIFPPQYFGDLLDIAESEIAGHRISLVDNSLQQSGWLIATSSTLDASKATTSNTDGSGTWRSNSSSKKRIQTEDFLDENLRHAGLNERTSPMMQEGDEHPLVKGSVAITNQANETQFPPNKVIIML